MNEQDIYKKLVEVSVRNDSLDLDYLLRTVSDIFNAKLVSLWIVNRFNNSVSIRGREGYFPSRSNEKEFVHSLNGTLIEFVLDKINTDKKLFYIIEDVDKNPYKDYHFSKERINKLHLKRLVSIPIFNKKAIGEQKVKAVLNIYPQQNALLTDSIVYIIGDLTSIFLENEVNYKLDFLNKETIHLFRHKRKKDLGSILHSVVNKILPKIFKFEGCSIFLWDSFKNKLTLRQSTGIKGNLRFKDVFYYRGEGVTGKILEHGKPVIFPSLKGYKNKKSPGFNFKFQEKTSSPFSSFMGCPIYSFSNPSDIIGVIRFTNKVNSIANVLDNFNEDDYFLVSSLCDQISLFWDYEHREKEGFAFAMQLAHEMYTPSFSIRGTAERLQRKWQDPNFPVQKIETYLSDIVDQSDLQIALINSFKHLWKGPSGKPKGTWYHIEKCNLEYDILISCKKLIIPFIRREHLRIDNIYIDINLPDMFFDKNAIRQVFYNLLTNAIKYRHPEREFIVSIYSEGLKEYMVPIISDSENIGIYADENVEVQKEKKRGYLIIVEDEGIGIEENERDKIFNLGFSKNKKTNAQGLGMGLTIAKQVLNDFHCRIWNCHEKNPTVFCIFIPELVCLPNWFK